MKKKRFLSALRFWMARLYIRPFLMHFLLLILWFAVCLYIKLFSTHIVTSIFLVAITVAITIFHFNFSNFAHSVFDYACRNCCYFDKAWYNIKYFYKTGSLPQSNAKENDVDSES